MSIVVSPQPALRHQSTEIKRLAVRPKVAWQMLGCGHDFGYRLLNNGDLDSFVAGGGRWITTESIERYIKRQLKQSGGSKVRKSPRKSAADS